MNIGIFNRAGMATAIRLARRIKEVVRLNSYYVYIACDEKRTMFITGLTDSLSREMHIWMQTGYNAVDMQGNKVSCVFLLYIKKYFYAQNAISKEKEISGWSIENKISFIDKVNPQWKFLQVN